MLLLLLWKVLENKQEPSQHFEQSELGDAIEESHQVIICQR